MNGSGCFLVQWETGNGVHYYVQFDTLEQHLDYFFSLEDLIDIHYIQFNDRYAIIPYYEHDYDSKSQQIQRLVNQFEVSSVAKNTNKCDQCYDEWLVI